MPPLLEPMITYGTQSRHGHPDHALRFRRGRTMPVFDKSLAYMGFEAGAPHQGSAGQRGVHRQLHQRPHLAICAARRNVLRGRKVAKGVQMLVIPGSQQVKRQAEAEGLDRIFIDAGAEWRESGCSMCLGMNGDTVARRASTR